MTNDTTWILNGFTIVKAGVTLTIDPGTYIQADPTSRGTLLVDRGAWLVAAGTKDQPITFRGEPGAERGQWGGIVLLGKGISNQVDPRNPSPNFQYEALTWARFTGRDDDDSSGVLTYVRLDGPGYPIMVDRELNGITLCAVGRKTKISHVQVNRGDDDGFEWFGGAANADHLIVTNETDDSYDIDHGYSGTIDYMIAIQRVEPPRERGVGSLLPFEPVGDNVIECSSSQGGEPRKSQLHWSHLTLIDNGGAGGVMDAKEDCAGTYEKVVMVAGGITPDSASVWALRAQGDFVISNITAPVPKLEFKDAFITGRWKKLIDVTALGVRNRDDSLAQVSLLQDVLKKYFKAVPYDSIHSFGLYKDLSPSDPAIIAAKAGAIVDGDLWYKDWTLPGTMDFPLGDTPNAGPPAVTFARTEGDLNAPASFTLKATATDADGIATLEILKGETVVASSTTGSVSFDTANVAAGSYTYTVRAKDNHAFNKLTTTQNLSVVVANPAPTVGLIRTGAENLVAPASFTLVGSATDVDGIASLEILLGNTVLGSNATGALGVDIANLAAGTYTYTIRAKDANTADPKTSSQELLVVVAEPPPNVPPTVTLEGPSEVVIAPGSFTLNATATDTDGAIASLQILEGTTVLGGSNTGSLSVPLTGKVAGTYTYTVKATDNHATDPKTVTGTLTVIVHEPPPVENVDSALVSLTLVNTETLIAPASFTLLATADDANGIDTLQVLLDGEVVATGTKLTLSVPIANKAAGTYKYTVRAKDKHPTDPKVSTRELEVVVTAPAPNVAPSLAFTRSNESDTLRAPASLTLHALAEDPNGIDTLQILLNGKVVGTSTNGVLSVPLTGLMAGSYTYTARAKDKHLMDPRVTVKELSFVIKPAAPPVALANPLHDLSEIHGVTSRGQDLVLESAGYGKVNVAVWSLSGRPLGARNVNLMQGQNTIPMGNLRGVHIVRLSNGDKGRSARVVFNALK
ncbi:MAG TPA: Ig-like domain-containing protein [Fibrobacteria bacterium]|nr:Ig-like domain-containing protein [Fibrobacteria bacterium]